MKFYYLVLACILTACSGSDVQTSSTDPVDEYPCPAGQEYKLVWNEEKGTIEGKAIPTDTPQGHLIEGLAKSGIKICFSTRCSGKVKPYRGPLAEGVMNAVEVQPGLKIISIDVVGQPSCQAAVTDTVYESEALNESVNNIITAKQIFDEEF